MSHATDEKRGGLGPIERAIRIGGGVVAVIIGLNLWLAGGGLSAWAWFGAALLGIDFIVTGVRGYCPLYARLGVGRPRIDARTSRAIRATE